MRETGELVKRLVGDKNVALQYVGVARVLLGRLISHLGTGVSGAQRFVLRDGTVIRAMRAGSQNIVEINVSGRKVCDPIHLIFLHGFLLKFTAPIVDDLVTLVMRPIEDPIEYFKQYTKSAADFDADYEMDSDAWGSAVVDRCGNKGPWYDPEPVAGDVNWYSDSLGPNYTLSWVGPKNRYFPRSIISNFSSPSGAFAGLSANLYYGGKQLAIAPGSVIGAAFHLTPAAGNSAAELRIRVATYVTRLQFKLYEALLPEDATTPKDPEAPSGVLQYPWVDKNGANADALTWTLMHTVNLDTDYKINTGVFFSQDASKVCFVAYGLAGARRLFNNYFYSDSKAFTVDFLTAAQAVVAVPNVEIDEDPATGDTITVLSSSIVSCSEVYDQEYPNDPILGAAASRTRAAIKYYTISMRQLTNDVNFFGYQPPTDVMLRFKGQFPLAVDFDAFGTPVVISADIELDPTSLEATRNGHGVSWDTGFSSSPPAPDPGPQCPLINLNLPAAGSTLGVYPVIPNVQQFEYDDVDARSGLTPVIAAANPTESISTFAYRVKYDLKVDGSLPIKLTEFKDRGRTKQYRSVMDVPRSSQLDIVLELLSDTWTGDLINRFARIQAMDLRKKLVLVYGWKNITNTTSEFQARLWDDGAEYLSNTAPFNFVSSTQAGTFHPTFSPITPTDPQLPTAPAGHLGVLPENHYLVFLQQGQVKLLRLKSDGTVVDFHSETKVPVDNDSIESIKTI